MKISKNFSWITLRLSAGLSALSDFMELSFPFSLMISVCFGIGELNVTFLRFGHKVSASGS